MRRGPELKVGDRVAFSAAWLRATGQIASPDAKGEWRGVVIAIEDNSPAFRLVVVDFKHRGKPIGFRKVLDVNLARVGSPQMNAD